MEQRGQFQEPVGYYDDRYSREHFLDVDRRDYRGESGPSRWSVYPTQRFNEYNHEFNDRQWRHDDYFYGTSTSTSQIGSVEERGWVVMRHFGEIRHGVRIVFVLQTLETT
jgi:hypothetical protein